MHLFSRGRGPSQNSHKYVLLRFGGENHLKRRSFSPPNPYTPWLGGFKKTETISMDFPQTNRPATK